MSRVVCAPAWTATWNPSGRTARNAFGDVPAFLHREEDSFTRRAAREDAVDAARREEPDQRGEGIGIERAPSILQRA